MSWMTQTEAAAALGCSVRTIRRRIRSNCINTRREGRNILVEVDTDKAVSSVTHVGRQLAEVGAAAAIQSKHDADTLAAVTDNFRDTLSVLSACRETLETEARRARRTARSGWVVATVLMLALSVGAWLYHRQSTDYLTSNHELQMVMHRKVSNLESRVSLAEAKYEVKVENLRAALAAEREHSAELAADRRSMADAQEALRADRDRAIGERHQVQVELMRVTSELKAIRASARFKQVLEAWWSEGAAALRELAYAAQFHALQERFLESGQDRAAFAAIRPFTEKLPDHGKDNAEERPPQADVADHKRQAELDGRASGDDLRELVRNEGKPQ